MVNSSGTGYRKVADAWERLDFSLNVQVLFVPAMLTDCFCPLFLRGFVFTRPACLDEPLTAFHHLVRATHKLDCALGNIEHLRQLVVADLFLLTQPAD